MPISVISLVLAFDFKPLDPFGSCTCNVGGAAGGGGGGGDRSSRRRYSSSSTIVLGPIHPE